MKSYNVYWVTLVFNDGSYKTVRFTASSREIAESKVKALPKFQTIVRSYILSVDTYKRVG